MNNGSRREKSQTVEYNYNEFEMCQRQQLYMFDHTIPYQIATNEEPILASLFTQNSCVFFVFGEFGSFFSLSLACTQNFSGIDRKILCRIFTVKRNAKLKANLTVQQ